MLQILIQAETLAELKTKALAALNMYELPQQMMEAPKPGEIQTQAPQQMESPSLPSTDDSQVRNNNDNVTNISKRTRRTKAEVEAERQSKNAKAPNAKEKIQNNFEAADEIAEIESPEEVSESDLLGEESYPPVDQATAQNALRDLLKKMSTPDALALLQKHGASKITAMSDTQRASFYAEAKSILGT